MLASGMTLRDVCGRPQMPHQRTVLDWALDPTHAFSAQYTRARELGYMQMADELLAISDDDSKDWVERPGKGKDGKPERLIDHENIARSRLRVDTRKWLLSKALPKVFGDRIISEHVGKIEHAHEVPQPIGEDRLAAVAKRFMVGPVRQVETAAKPNGKTGNGRSDLH